MIMLCRKTHTKDTQAMQGRCGEQNGMFYDRRGDFFREGVDPRNHYGRFVHHFNKHPLKVHPEWKHEYDCPAGFSDRPCDCGEPN